MSAGASPVSIRGRIYRTMARTLLAPWIRRSRAEDAAAGGGFEVYRLNSEEERGGAQRARAWFHAASVGELESLWPVILAWAERDCDLVVTIFSRSARDRLPRLRAAIGKIGKGRVLAMGFSPCEGEWSQWLAELSPGVFVTAKYEAWPDLWLALSEQGVPLLTLGAKARGSLKACRKIIRLLGASLPRMTLLAAGASDVAPLKGLFPAADVRPGREPRWDQVLARSKAGHERSRMLIESWAALPRPWGILGSVWPEDLDQMSGTLSEIPGTLWVVPHRIEETHLREIEARLGPHQSPPRSSANALPAPDVRCVLIDEMGFLSELYSAADWAFVGGGFGQGVHSTIEPAIHGIPIAAGPARAGTFQEIEELSRTGQLTLVRDAGEWKAWIAGLGERLSNKDRWKGEARERLGGTESVLKALVEIVSPGAPC